MLCNGWSHQIAKSEEEVNSGTGMLCSKSRSDNIGRDAQPNGAGAIKQCLPPVPSWRYWDSAAAAVMTPDAPPPEAGLPRVLKARRVPRLPTALRLRSTRPDQLARDRVGYPATEEPGIGSDVAAGAARHRCRHRRDQRRLNGGQRQGPSGLPRALDRRDVVRPTAVPL